MYKVLQKPPTFLPTLLKWLLKNRIHFVKWGNLGWVMAIFRCSFHTWLLTMRPPWAGFTYKQDAEIFLRTFKVKKCEGAKQRC